MGWQVDCHKGRPNELENCEDFKVEDLCRVWLYTQESRHSRLLLTSAACSGTVCLPLHCPRETACAQAGSDRESLGGRR